MKLTQIITVVVGLIVLSLLSGFIGAWAWNNYMISPQDRISNFFATENAVGVSPSDYITALQQNSSMGTLVDLRDNSSYDTQHFVGAINIPASQMNPPQLLNAFKKLPAGEPVIVYCYSSYCMLSIEVGNYLAQNGVYVKHFNLGWAELKTDFPDFLVNGTSPGYLSVNATTASTGCPATGGGFGC